MFGFLSGIPMKWVGLGLIILIIGGYIGFLKIENSHYQSKIKNQENEIVQLKQVIENQKLKIAGCESAVDGLQEQNKTIMKNNKNAISNFNKIKDTLNNSTNVQQNEVKGVMSDDTSKKVINIYNDIINPFISN